MQKQHPGSCAQHAVAPVPLWQTPCAPPMEVEITLVAPCKAHRPQPEVAQQTTLAMCQCTRPMQQQHVSYHTCYALYKSPKTCNTQQQLATQSHQPWPAPHATVRYHNSTGADKALAKAPCQGVFKRHAQAHLSTCWLVGKLRICSLPTSQQVVAASDLELACQLDSTRWICGCAASSTFCSFSLSGCR